MADESGKGSINKCIIHMLHTHPTAATVKVSLFYVVLNLVFKIMANPSFISMTTMENVSAVLPSLVHHHKSEMQRN